MIEIKGLAKRFGEQEVLRGIDLSIRNGETLAVIGRSGCGKSVLLKHIIGLMKADDGEVWVDGVEMGSATPTRKNAIRETIGFLFQSAALFDSMDVWENVTLGLRENGITDREELRRVAQAKLSLVGLSGTMDMQPAELSGGMRKRVGLARALASEPEYMFYDEPTTGLDPVTSDQIDILINDLTKRLSATSLIVTHDMFTVERIAHRVVFLDAGKIYFDGTPAELLASKDVRVREFLARYRTVLS